MFGSVLPDDAIVGSPLKKHRASLYDMDAETMAKRLGAGMTTSTGGDIMARAYAEHGSGTQFPQIKVKEEPVVDEEL